MIDDKDIKIKNKYYIIKDKNGNILKNKDNKIIMCEYPIQAEHIIDRWFNSNKSLVIEKFKKNEYTRKK